MREIQSAIAGNYILGIDSFDINVPHPGMDDGTTTNVLISHTLALFFLKNTSYYSPFFFYFFSFLLNTNYAQVLDKANREVCIP